VQRARKGNPRTRTINILRRREERRKRFRARANETRIGEEEQWLHVPELAWGTLNVQGVMGATFAVEKRKAPSQLHAFLPTLQKKDIVVE
jgi:hypothetical protein